MGHVTSDQADLSDENGQPHSSITDGWDFAELNAQARQIRSKTHGKGFDGIASSIVGEATSVVATDASLPVQASAR